MRSAWSWLPGGGALRAGHTRLGILLFAVWLGQVILWLWRGPYLLDGLLHPLRDVGGLGHRSLDTSAGLAAWSSVAFAAGAWVFGLPRWYGRQAVDTTGPGPRRRALEQLLSSPASGFALAGCILLLMIALLSPALAPLDPLRIGDGIASHNLPPLSRIFILLGKDGSRMAANDVELVGDGVRVRRQSTWTTIARSGLQGSRPADWLQTRTHLLGTDHLGRDLLSRILVGSRVSLGVGLLAALLAGALGATIGGISGWAGPRVDGLLMRLTDASLAFPRLFLILLVLTVVPGSFVAVIIVLGVTGWMAPCRLVRAQVLSIREQGFVQAARALGRRDTGIIWRHLLPNAMAPLLVATTLRVGDTILLEAGLSFLGLGVPPPHATWGNLISGGRPSLAEAWWVATFPGLALVTTVILFNLLGDGLRKALARR